MATCHQQLELAKSADTVQALTETMLRDLQSCRPLCESLHRRSPPQHARCDRCPHDSPPLVPHPAVAHWCSCALSRQAPDWPPAVRAKSRSSSPSFVSSGRICLPTLRVMLCRPYLSVPTTAAMMWTSPMQRMSRAPRLIDFIIRSA